MGKTKGEFKVKLRRKIIAWEETTYNVSARRKEDAIDIAKEELLYTNFNTSQGIIDYESKIVKESLQRISQEQSWILSPRRNGIGEQANGDPVCEVVEVISYQKRQPYNPKYYKPKKKKL